MIDTHAHLYASEFENDINQTIQRAVNAGVKHIVLPAIDSQSHRELINLYKTNPDFFIPFMGLHPTSVNEKYKHELAVVEKHLHENVFLKGIGEIGIDLYWDKTYYKQQVDALQIQLNWAKELNKPVIIHVRNSFDETYNVIKPLQNGKLKGIFHCFGENAEVAKQITDMGFMLGIGGVVTFKNTHLRETLKSVDLQDIVLETDSPYLAPVPYRGKRNEPAYMQYITAQLAQVYNTDVQTIINRTTENFNHLFEV